MTAGEMQIKGIQEFLYSRRFLLIEKLRLVESSSLHFRTPDRIAQFLPQRGSRSGARHRCKPRKRSDERRSRLRQDPRVDGASLVRRHWLTFFHRSMLTSILASS